LELIDEYFVRLVFDVLIQICFLQLDGATYQSKVEIMCGGVGRNIAEGIYKLNGDVFLITAVGDDHYGKFLRNSFPPNSCIVQTKKYASASCAVILDSTGDCRLIAGDMSAHREIGPDIVMIFFLTY
jgi:pseudouridylate synthase / pseudouridine kinase